MNPTRSTQPWPTVGLAILGCLLCWVSNADAAAFLSRTLVNPVSNCHYDETEPPSTCLRMSKPSTNRYSSSSVAETSATNHVSSLYTEGHTYKKTVQRVRKMEDRTTDSPSHEEATIPRNKFLNELNRYPSLVLNADYQPMSYLPLSVCHWQEAIKLIFSGKVAVVDVYDGVTIRAANLEIPLPSVIALNEYVPQCSHKPAFTRRNVFLRDEYTCQYCNDAFHTRDLSIDHVVPRCMGGRLNWENAVTSCLKCNGRKGNMLVSDLKQVGMKLQTTPRAPTRHELAMKAGRMLPRKVHPTWRPYLASVFGDGDVMEDANRPTPDLEALGIVGENGQLEDDKPKKMSKNQKKRKNKKKSPAKETRR